MDKKQQNEAHNKNQPTKMAWEKPMLSHIKIGDTRIGIGSVPEDAESGSTVPG